MTPKSRQIIYVEIDEEVTTIFERIKGLRRKEIYLIVPKKAILFQSIVNIKILKVRLEENNKKLIIVTSDRNGKHISEKAGIKVLRRVEVEKLEVHKDDAPQMKIQPIQARRNITQKEERPERFTEKKISIRELLSEFRMQNNGKKRGYSKDMDDFKFMRPKRKFIALIILVSIGLFALITYIALPSATIYIRPKFDNLDHSVNIILADKRKNQTLIKQGQPHVIPSEIVSTSTKQTKIFKTTSKQFNGKNAKGKIRIINTFNEEWELRKGTRFQSYDGIIFRIKKGIIVPPKKRDETGEMIPGEIIVSIEADPFDIYGQPVGKRGNLEPGRFIIPGLSKYNQRLIWAESDSTFKGGITSYREMVKKEDIESAKKQIEDNLIMMAKEDLRTYIDEVNKINKTKLTLLDDSRYLKTELEDMRLSDGLEGSFTDKFEIFAKINAEGVAFDFNQLFIILKKELGTRTHPNMQIRDDSIVPENITYEVINKDDALGQIKITATVIGIEEFVIDDSVQAGARFGTKVKEKVIGLNIEEAENLIGNLPEVDAVQIKTWPIWINNIPRIRESIEIKLMD